MTLLETVEHFAGLAAAKSNELKQNTAGFWTSALMAGAYVGMGIILIFSVGQHADPSIRNLIMGASFGIALTLVVFAGSELFTGHTMYAALGRLTGSCTTGSLLRLWSVTWIGNLAGSLLLAALFVLGGGGSVLSADGQDLLHAVAAKKMAGSPVELIALGMLCNWLVCLALWAGARTRSDAAKCIIIFWCLYAFIAAGFEHSVANMTIFAIALLSEHTAHITPLGAAHNLLWVTIGNILSGSVIVATGYWLAAGQPRFDNAGQMQKG
jgi:nitrite transporter